MFNSDLQKFLGRPGKYSKPDKTSVFISLFLLASPPIPRQIKTQLLSQNPKPTNNLIVMGKKGLLQIPLSHSFTGMWEALFLKLKSRSFSWSCSDHTTIMNVSGEGKYDQVMLFPFIWKSYKWQPCKSEMLRVSAFRERLRQIFESEVERLIASKTCLRAK